MRKKIKKNATLCKKKERQNAFFIAFSVFY